MTEAERGLAPRYWDLDIETNRKELESWRQMAGDLCLLVITPERIRTG